MLETEFSTSLDSRPPTDWPGPGPIDLTVQDLPHASSSIEWWYLHGHFTLEGGRDLSLFAVFFRNKVGREDTLREGRAWRHHLAWGFTEEGRRHICGTLLDPATPSDAARLIRSSRRSSDDRFRRALLELTKQGRFPAPDRLLRAPGLVATDRLLLDLDGNHLESSEPGVYTLRLDDAEGPSGCHLRFTSLKPPQRHGIDGHVLGFSVRHMFYYFQPRCRVEGTIKLDGVEHRVIAGEGWVDHEFGRHEEGRPDDDPYPFGWTWFAAQLDDGSEITCYETFDRGRRDRVIERNLIVISPEGTCETFRDFSLEPIKSWTSVRTFATYPVDWRLRVPAAAIDFTIKAAAAQQEVMTLLTYPGFWEGRVHVAGISQGQDVQGKGYVELSGLGHDSMDQFFSAVGAETRRAVDAFVPPVLQPKDLIRLYASERDAGWVRGIDTERAAHVITNPLREITLRGGKAWRSYALLACLEAAGADPERYRHWIVLPEILHSGSLIIDDVQDRSTVRRGGPACHVMYGEASAINVGGVAPYLALVVPLADDIPGGLRAKIYELFHQALRAAYLGQALDVMGLHDMIPGVVETGDAQALEQAVLTMHRLKSAVPPSALARAAVQVANGTPAEENALAGLFEAYGLAFQIVDDVLNLRGFEEKLKNRGEDLVEGKITMPVAKAFGRLDWESRKALWDVLSTGARDSVAVEKVIALLEQCGALDDCMQEAYAIVEEAWSAVAPLIADSQAKLMLRAFGWYILERHY
jgi:geranylgeranyl pyrophosphate synthase/predicted secreted hydrolase